MAYKIDLDELQDEMAAAKAEFDRWAHATTTAADNLRARYLHTVKEAQDVITHKQEELRTLQARAAELQQRISTERDAEGRLAAELATVRSEAAALPAQIASLRQRLAAERDEFERSQSRTTEEHSAAQKRIHSLRECIALYEQCLGLTFLQGEQEELQLLMNQIDPRAPDRVFMFAVRVSDDNTYQLTKISPAVDGWQPLLATLNTSPDAFYVFVRRMRKLFSQAAATGKV